METHPTVFGDFLQSPLNFFGSWTNGNHLLVFAKAELTSLNFFGSWTNGNLVPPALADEVTARKLWTSSEVELMETSQCFPIDRLLWFSLNFFGSWTNGNAHLTPGTHPFGWLWTSSEVELMETYTRERRRNHKGFALNFFGSWTNGNLFLIINVGLYTPLNFFGSWTNGNLTTSRSAFLPLQLWTSSEVELMETSLLGDCQEESLLWTSSEVELMETLSLDQHYWRQVFVSELLRKLN